VREDWGCRVGGDAAMGDVEKRKRPGDGGQERDASVALSLDLGENVGLIYQIRSCVFFQPLLLVYT
jgi:hypothetical protein